MRLVSFNVSSGRSSVDGRVDVDRFAEAIAALDADVLCLQEVDRDQPRSGGADLTERAAQAMGAEHRAFAPTLYGTPGGEWVAADGRARTGPAYGCALLSRLPLSTVDVLRMPAAPVTLPLWAPGHGVMLVREEPRVAMIATVVTGLGAITVVGTHLSFVPGWNRRQLRRIVREVGTRPDPVLLMGDLNLRGSSPSRVSGFRGLIDAPTFPAARPRWQLDHVLVRGSTDDFGAVTARGAIRTGVSDHRAVFVDVDLAR